MLEPDGRHSRRFPHCMVYPPSNPSAPSCIHILFFLSQTWCTLRHPSLLGTHSDNVLACANITPTPVFREGNFPQGPQHGLIQHLQAVQICSHLSLPWGCAVPASAEDIAQASISRSPCKSLMLSPTLCKFLDGLE